MPVSCFDEGGKEVQVPAEIEHPGYVRAQDRELHRMPRPICLDHAVSPFEKLAVLVAGSEEIGIETRAWRRAPSQPHGTEVWLKDRAELLRKLKRDGPGAWHRASSQS